MLKKKLRPNKGMRGDPPTQRFPQQATKAEFQMGGVSLLGYSKNSPYKDRPYLDINSPNGSITMKDTEIPLHGMDETGYSQIMYPGQEYSFPGKKIRETPLQKGGYNFKQLFDYIYEDDEKVEEPESKVTKNTAPSVQELMSQESNDEMALRLLEEDEQYMGSVASPYSSSSSSSSPSKEAGKYGQEIISQLSSSLGYTPQFNSIGRTPEKQQSLINQGLGVPNSWHLTGDAVDMKPEDWNKLPKEKQSYFKSNYDVVNHNNHYHIEPKGKRYQMGGLSKSDIEKKLGLEQKLHNQKMQQKQSSISQYTPQAGDQERMNASKDVYRREEAKPFNRAASSQVAANAMNNIVEPMVEIEMGIGAGKIIKAGVKQAIKSLSKKELRGSQEIIKGPIDWADGVNREKNPTFDKTAARRYENSVKSPYQAPIQGEGSPYKSSEIDWGKWNKEITENKSLMNEYNNIERTTKQNGTWMKNSNGSKFNGTPEQFVQQNSSNFKKAFPEGYEKGYRGAHQYIDDFKNRDRNDYATFLTDSKLNAETYAGSDDISKNFYHPDVNKSGEWVDGVHEIGIPKNYSKVVGNAEGNNWRFLNYDKKIADGINPGRLKDSQDFRISNLNSDIKSGIDYPNDFGVDKRYLTTDDYASYVKNNAEGIAEIKNVKDQMGYTNNIKPNTIYAVDAERVPLKSLRHNNGMFDMKNPNIYKALVPPVVGVAANKSFNRYGGYQRGGVYTGMSYEDIAQLKKLGYKFDFLD